jgi:hypothetical protein
MSDRPTPEVDALAVVCYGEGGIDVSLGFRALPLNDARNLERQRDEARELARELRDALSVTVPHLESIVSHNESLNGRESPKDRADLIVVQAALAKAKEVLP